MNPKRSPYEPSSTFVPASTVYDSAPPIAAASSTPLPFPPPAAYSFDSTVGGAILSEPSPTNTAIPVIHLEVSTPNQAAIIAISVICGLLLIALLFVILVMIGKRREREIIRLGIGGGGGGGNSRRRKRRSARNYTEYGDDRFAGFGLENLGMRPAANRHISRAGSEMDIAMRGARGPLSRGNDPRMGKDRRASDVEEEESI